MKSFIAMFVAAVLLVAGGFALVADADAQCPGGKCPVPPSVVIDIPVEWEVIAPPLPTAAASTVTTTEAVRAKPVRKTTRRIVRRFRSRPILRRIFGRRR